MSVEVPVFIIIIINSGPAYHNWFELMGLPHNEAGSIYKNNYKTIVVTISDYNIIIIANNL